MKIKKDSCEYCALGDKKIEESKVCIGCLNGKRKGFRKAGPRILKKRGLK